MPLMADPQPSIWGYPLPNTVPVQNLQGPSYLYAILMDSRIRDGDW
jgi:hypothetical protein